MDLHELAACVHLGSQHAEGIYQGHGGHGFLEVDGEVQVVEVVVGLHLELGNHVRKEEGHGNAEDLVGNGGGEDFYQLHHCQGEVEHQVGAGIGLGDSTLKANALLVGLVLG